MHKEQYTNSGAVRGNRLTSLLTTKPKLKEWLFISDYILRNDSYLRLRLMIGIVVGLHNSVSAICTDRFALF